MKTKFHCNSTTGYDIAIGSLEFRCEQKFHLKKFHCSYAVIADMMEK